MIVVIGEYAVAGSGSEAEATGAAARVARSATAAGARVEAVGKLGEDPAGDALVLALARVGIGHAAVLRDPTVRTIKWSASSEDADDVAAAGSEVVPIDDGAVDGGGETAVETVGETAGESGSGPGVPAPSLEPADLTLALRYLTDYRVIVAVYLGGPALVAEAAEAATWAAAHLVILAHEASSVPAELPPGALVIVAPRPEGEGLADLVGRYAAAVDAGQAPAAAYDAIRDAVGA